MKFRLIYLLLILIFFTPVMVPFSHAQESVINTEEVTDEFYREFKDEDLDPALQVEDDEAINSDINAALSELNTLSAAFGTQSDDGSYFAGALGRLKLKPSDKKRLIKIANGSLTEREKRQVVYDRRLMELLALLVTPKELGGGGLTHLRVGDLLRFRNDPRSRETEGADNVSQHQFGKAADIVEINKISCTKKGLLSSKKLEPFPVKVIWQGGAPNNPSLSILANFDAIARANAFRDILGSLPGDSYNGAIQGFEDLLQQLQRRVVSQELQLDPATLDFLSHNDGLETLGRETLNRNLELSIGALAGDTTSEVMRSIPRSYIERALLLPPTSLQGDDWNQSFERLGRIVVAYQLDIDPDEILNGRVDKITNSAYVKQYRELEKAFRWPSGSLEGIKANRVEAFRQIGALLLADRLQYAPDERDELLAQARGGSITQLSLARYGDIQTFPGNVLPIIAPREGSSKAEGENYYSKKIIEANNTPVLSGLPDTVRAVVESNIPLLKTVKTKQQLVAFISEMPVSKRQLLFRQIGAKYMEDAFDLPEESLMETVEKHSNPTVAQFEAILQKHLSAADRENKVTGKSYFESDLRDSFNDLYHSSPAGPSSFTQEEVLSILLGKTTPAASRAGASWVEEDLGLVPGSLAALFAVGTAEDRLVNAGLQVIGGELFEAFDVDASTMQTGTDLRVALGQARIETSLGLKPGSFRDSFTKIRGANTSRIDTIFVEPGTVDTIIGVPQGLTAQLMAEQTTPKDIALIAGGYNLDTLKTEDLQNKLGWDSAYKIDGERLLRTINSSDGTTKGVSDGKTYTMRGLLAQIGAYNSDFAFGYEAGTIEQWVSARQDGSQNIVLAKQGAKLYSDRLGVDPNLRDLILEAYLSGKDDAKRRFIADLKKRLEGDPASSEDSVILTAAKELAKDEISKIEVNLDERAAKSDIERNAIRLAKSTLNKAKEKLDQPTLEEGNENEKKRTRNDVKQTQPPPKISTQDLLNAVKLDIAEAKRQIESATPPDQEKTPLLSATQEQLNSVDTRIESEITKFLQKNKIKGAAIDIPTEDLMTFVEGDMKIANSVIMAARQARQTVIDVGDTYKLFRTIVSGWNSDKEYERALAHEITERYKSQLQDYAAAKAAQAVEKGIEYLGAELQQFELEVDAQFNNLTKGVLAPGGELSENDSPYHPTIVERIQSGYFSNKEARNNFYYATMDAQIREKDPTLPKNFSKTIMEGSNADRSKMMYLYLGTKTATSIISTLPEELRPLADDYLKNYNPNNGKVFNPDYDPDKEPSATNQKFLTEKQIIDEWANSIATVTLRKQDPSLPKNVGEIIRQGTKNDRLKLGYDYLLAKQGDNIVASLPPDLRPLAITYMTNYDPISGKVVNPNFDRNKPESNTNKRYLDSNTIIDNWAGDTLTQYMRRLDPNMPANAGQTVLDGTDLDRKKLAYSLISTKLADPLISTLPTDLQPLANSFMQNFDVATGKILAARGIFVDWASSMIEKYIGSKIPPEVMKLAMLYVTEGTLAVRDFLQGKAVDEVFRFADKIEAKINALIEIGKEKLIVWVGKQLGLPVEEMQAYYEKYKQAKTVYKAFKAGKMDVAELVLAVDQLLLDGKISKLVGKIDTALGLPAGSAQSLILFAVTGNPVYVIQFAFTLFFGFTLKCPNLQESAQRNVRELISLILDVGRYRRELVPSQIITLREEYITELAEKIKQNYLPCLTVANARCGVFARPEYAKQVHIGF